MISIVAVDMDKTVFTPSQWIGANREWSTTPSYVRDICDETYDIPLALRNQFLPSPILFSFVLYLFCACSNTHRSARALTASLSNLLT